MRKVLRYNFNMVEVMLAVVIVAVGMASTFVLFPVGLNSYKQAMAENSIADIAEYVSSVARLNAQYSLYADAAPYGFYTDESHLKQVFCKKTDKIDAVDVDSPTGWTSVNGSETMLQNNTTKGIYLIRQISGPADNRIVDFSAIAQVYLDSTDLANEYFPQSGTGDYIKYSTISGSKSINSIDNYLLSAILKISWPATVPESERETRYFRFEIFNPYYEQSTGTP